MNSNTQSNTKVPATQIPGVVGNLDDLKTGDLLLFGDSPFWFSDLIRYFSKSKYSHIGIILRDPTYIDPKLTGLYLWESGSENFVDSEDDKKKFGVQITNLHELLSKKENNSSIGFLDYRSLYTDKTKEYIEQKIKEIHQKVHNIPYDTDLNDFLEASSDVNIIEPKTDVKPRTWLSWMIPNHRKTNTFFCSALVGYVYTQLGLLPKETEWSQCSPQFFSSEENPKCYLTSGSYLNKDKRIFNNPAMKK